MKTIMFLIILVLPFVFVNTAESITASNIEWWSSRTASGLPGDTLKEWTESVEGELGFPENLGTGTIYYVDSGVAIEGDGSSWTNAFNTLQEAIDQSSTDSGDNQGDRIYVAQAHAETVGGAAGIGVDVPGLIIVGHGKGEDMPTFSLSINASTFEVSVADVTLYNLRFISTKTAGGVAQGIDVTSDGDGFRMIGCEMRETSVDTEFTKALNISADADECFIVGNRFIFFAEGTGGDAVAVTLEGGSDQSVIAYNQFIGDWSGYVIDGTAAQSLNLLIEGNIIHNYDTTAGLTMGFEATTTGDIIGNKCYGNHASGYAIVANAMFVSPDNVAMGTEDVETRNYESMFGAFTGTGTAQTSSVKASLDLAHTDLDAIITAVGSVSGFHGEVSDTGTTESTTCLPLAGYGTNFFETDWVMIVNLDVTGGSTGEIVDVTGYTTLTGVITHAAISEALVDGDKIQLARRETVLFDDVVLTDPVAGSLASYIAGTTSLGTDLGTSKSLVDVLGSDGTTVANTATSVLGAVGINVAAATTNFTSATSTADRDGSLIERSEFVIATLSTGTPDKVTAPADTYTIIDILGSTGAVTTGAVAGSILGAIGTDEVADDTPFASTSVEADADGSVLERLEQIDTDTSAILADTGTDGVVLNATGLADDTIDVGAFATGAISNAVIETDAIGAAEIAADAIGASELAADAVAEIAGGIMAIEHSGDVWYVSDAGDNSTGLSWATAYQLVKTAENAASAGDTIMIAEGHEELLMTAAKSVTFNLADMKIVGKGEGDQRPLIRLTETTSAITINAAGITLKNLRIQPAITDTTVGVSIGADATGTWIENVAFIDGVTAGTDEFVDAIVIDDAAADVTIKDCTYFNSGTDGHTDTFVNLDDTGIENPTIIGCTVYGDFAEGSIWGAAIVSTNVRIEDNTITNTNTGEPTVEFSGGTTGVLVNNRFKTDAWATMIDPGSLSCIGNLGTITTDEQAIPVPISGNSTTVAEEDDGSEYERLEYLQNKSEDILAGIRMAGGSVGDVYYVDDGGSGGTATTWATASTTLDAGFSLATANVGDIVFVAPAHDEDISGAIAIDTAGVTVIGIGEGSEQPQIVHTATGSIINVSGAGSVIKNINFHSSTAVSTKGMYITGPDCVIEDCLFTDVADNEFGIFIDIGADAERTTIRNCTLLNLTGTTGSTAGIAVTAGAVDRLVIEDCVIWGDFGDTTAGAIYSTAINTRALIRNNVITNNNAADYAILLNAATTGNLTDNKLYSNAWATMLDPGSLICSGNTGSISIDQQAITMPISSDTSAIEEDGDGSDLERLEYLQNKSDDILAGIRMMGGTIGNVWYVNDGGGGGDGDTWADAEVTLADGYAHATANVGDYVFVAPAHAEVLADAAITLDTDGVTIIGIGNEAEMPEITMTDENSSLVITGVGITIKNIRFHSTTVYTDEAVWLSTGSQDFTIEDCLFTDVTGNHVFRIAVRIGADGENCTIRNCRFESTSGNTSATSAIAFSDGVIDRLTIEDCHIWGDFDNAGIYNITNACTNTLIKNNVVTNNEADDHAIEIAGACTGDMIGNMLYSDSYGVGLDPGSMKCYNNKHVYAVDMGAIDVPLVAGKTYTLMANQSSITASTDPLFTIAGGPILIIDFFGVVPTGATMGDATVLIQSVATTGPTTFPYTTAVSVNGDAVGTTYTFDDSVPSVMVPLLGAQNLNAELGPLRWYAPTGTVDQLGGGAVTGVIDWYMTFRPLGPSVVVTDAS